MNFYSKYGLNKVQRQGLAAPIIGAFAALLLLISSSNVRANEVLQDHKRIYELASAYIKQETGQVAQLKPLNSKQRISKCLVPISIDFPFNNQKTVRVQCHQTSSTKTPQWKFHLQVAISQTLNTWQTKTALKAGQLISAADVSLVNYQGHSFGQLLTDKTSPIGRYTKHAIKKQHWLRQSDLSKNIRIWRTKDPIKVGTLLSREMLVPVTVNQRQTSANVITNVAQIVGKVSRYNLAAGRAITQQDVSGRQQVWLALKNLPTGLAIVADDLYLDWRLDYQLRQPGYSDISKIVGQVPKSYITKGRIITANLLRTPYLVDKGSTVRLTITRANLTISTEVKALSNGNKGDRVKVEVIDSGKLREGIVIAKGVLKLLE